jgi:hypothetical protein
MTGLTIGTAELRQAALIGGAALLGFLLLAGLAGWPNAAGGWPFAVGVSLALGLLPVAGKALGFLREGRGKVAAAGFTLDFSAAVPAATAGAGPLALPGNIIRPGRRIDDSGSQELDRVAAELVSQGDLVIDLGAGDAWYATRLYAVAATMQMLGRPARLVLAGQRGGEAGQFLGWIGAGDVVAAMERADARHARVRRQSEAYLARLRATSGGAPPGDPALPRLGEFDWHFQRIGEAAAMRILIEQMRRLDALPSATAPPGLPLEPEDDPPWLSPGQAVALFDAWLVTEKVEATQPQRAQMLAILDSRHDVIASVRDGRFQGFIEVRRAERAILRQLAERAG